MRSLSTALLPFTGWRHRFAVVTFIAVMLSCPAVIRALDPQKAVTQFRHRKWGAADGIGGIECIAQTPDGYLWLAASNGLFRYDGTAFQRWEPPAGDPALPSSLRRLYVCRDGALWMVSYTAVACLRDGHLTVYSRQDAFIDSYIASIFEGPDGAIWLGKQTGLSRFASGRWEKIGSEMGLPEGTIFAPCVDKKGNIWLFSSGSRNPSSWLVSLAPGEKTFQTAKGGRGRVNMTMEGPDGRLWIADFSPNSGVRPIEKDRTKIQIGHPIVRVGSYGFVFDRDGGLWVSSAGDGLRRVRDVAKLGDRDVSQFGDEADKFTEKDGLSGDAMHCIFEDREGNIWTGTTAGLDCFSETKFTALSMAEGLPFDRNVIVQAARDGSVWIGTNTDGFALLRSGQTQFENRHWFDLKPSWGWVVRATAIYPDPSGDLFLGSGMGLLRIHDGVAELAQDEYLRTLVAITGMARESSGNLVIGDAVRGLWVLKDEKAMRLAFNGMKMEHISAVFGSDRNGLWAAETEGGVVGRRSLEKDIYRYTEADGLFAGAVRQIFQDSRERLWVLGAGGLSRWQGERFQTLDRRHGLPEQDLFSAIIDDDGAFWLSGSTGLFQVTVAELDRVLDSGAGTVHGQYFDHRNGLRGILGFHEFGGNWAAKTPDGKLWFAMNTGLAVIDPKHISCNPLPPPVWIQSVKAGGKTYPASGKQIFPSNARNCEFQYVALSFVDPEKVRYRYRLEGFEQNWVEAEGRREAFYSNLRPGNYRFHVIACNNDGVWNETGSAVAFSIPPAFYETFWFPMLCMIPVGLSLWGWHRLRLTRLARRLNQQLEVQQQERKRIAQELHDTLLQGFTGVGLKLEAIATQLPESLGPTRDRIHAILDDSDRYLAEARRAVWALRSASFAEASDFSSAVAHACKPLVDGTDIQFDFAVTGTPRPLSAAAEDNLLRVCQEATANAVKHAAPTRISVQLSFEESKVRLTISDNGCGFDPGKTATLRKGHFGLAGMRERAEALGGTVSVQSQKGQGTTISVSIPMDQNG